MIMNCHWILFDVQWIIIAVHWMFIRCAFVFHWNSMFMELPLMFITCEIRCSLMFIWSSIMLSGMSFIFIRCSLDGQLMSIEVSSETLNCHWCSLIFKCNSMHINKISMKRKRNSQKKQWDSNEHQWTSHENQCNSHDNQWT